MINYSIMRYSGLLALVGFSLACAGCMVEVSDQCDEVHSPESLEQVSSIEQQAVDCRTWTDTGYVKGKSFTITLVKVDGKPVEISTANAYVVMQQAAEKAGVKIRIVSGFRTYAQQQYLYNCYLTKKCNNGNLAAKPGYSNHQSGHALDLNTSNRSVRNWLNKYGGSYGFKRTVSNEPWHWEWWGGGPGGGPCNGGNAVTTCTANGETGECISTSVCSSYKGSYKSTPGLCPGPADIQCCTGKTTCEANGKSGECMRSDTCKAKGSNFVSTPGHCPGPSYFQCCTSTQTDPAPDPDPDPDPDPQPDPQADAEPQPQIDAATDQPEDSGFYTDADAADVGYSSQPRQRKDGGYENDQDDAGLSWNDYYNSDGNASCQLTRGAVSSTSPLALLVAMFGFVALRRRANRHTH